MGDIQEIRDLFPFLAHATYLNTAAAGLSWNGLSNAAGAFYEGIQRGICAQDEWAVVLKRARTQMRELLGLNRQQKLYFTGSATESLNRTILGLPLTAGDRIVVTSDEFPSVVQPCLLFRDHGVEITKVSVHQESERCDALIKAVSQGAQLVAVSHVHWRTGTRIDLERLSAECRKNGAWLIVDGVQAVGAIPAQAEFADAYCGSTFKWLLSGFGLGFVAMSDRLSERWTPPFRGYNNEFPSRRPQYSHVNYPAVYALSATLELLESIGWRLIHRRVAELTDYLFSSLATLGLDVVTPREDKAGIVTIQNESASQVVPLLAEQSIYVEDRDRMVRASPHFYNVKEDLDRYLSVLAHRLARER